MTPTAARGATPLVAVAKDSKVKPLGYVTWFSVPDQPVKLRTLRQEWQIAGLDPDVLPPEPRPLYLFKRAMRVQEGKVRLDDGGVIETDVKDVAEDGDLCVYQISRVVRDADQRVVDYPKAMRVTYIKATEELTFDALGGVPMSDLLPMEEAISDYFEKNGKMIDGRKVREAVRNFLKDDPDEQAGKIGLAGENMRGKAGGVYFIAAKHKQALDGLAEALHALYGKQGDNYGLYTVPLADGAGEREMVRRAHVNNSVKETKEAIAEVSRLLRADRQLGIRAATVEHHFRRLRQLERRAAEYASLLKDEEEDVNDIIEIMRKQLEKLVVA